MSQADYTRQIVGLIQQQGAERARAAEQSGQIWGGALANLGQIPLQVQQQQRLKEHDKIQQQEVALRGQELDQRTKAFAQGLIDKKRAHDDDAIEQLGTFIHESGNTLEALQSGLQSAKRAGLLSDEEIAPILAGAQEDPSRVGMLSRGMIARTEKGRERIGKVTTYKAGEVGRRDFDNTTVFTAPQAPPKNRSELAFDAANPSSPTQAQSTTALDLSAPIKAEPAAVKPPAIGSFEDYVLRGAKAKGKTPEELSPTDIEAFRKAYQQADDRPRIDVRLGGSTPAGDFNKEGKDFLATVPAPWRKTVEKIANYDEDPTKVASMRGGMRETLMQWVNQVNPAYDASQFTNRAPTRKAFTTGVQGQQINAINTAIGHIDQLTTLAKELDNGGFVPANQAFNTIRTMFGSDKVTNFDTLKDALAGEVSAVLAKGGATVSGIAEAKEKIKGSNSPEQLAGYVKTLIPIFGSKLAALDDQYKQAMGNDSFSALSAESKRILTKNGFDPAHPVIQGGGEAGPAQTRTIRNTKTGETKTQTSTDGGKTWR